MPIGVYGYPGASFLSNNADHAKELASAGFNTYFLDLIQLATTDLDHADAWCMDVTALTGPGFQDVWLNQPAQFVTGSSLDQKINLVKNHAGFLAYYTYDEPYLNWYYNYQPTPPVYNNLIAGRQFVEARDPNHPVYVVESPGYGSIYQTWSQVGHTYGEDIYPVGDAAYTLSSVGQYTDYSIQNTGGTKPIWMVLQGQGLRECDSDPSNNGPRPKLMKTRFMAYDAVIHYAKGLYWWGTSWIEPTSTFWKDIKVTAGEMRDLQQVIVSGTTTGGVTLGNSNLEALHKVYSGDHYLIVANKSSLTRSNVQITVSGWGYSKNGNKTVVLFEKMLPPASVPARYLPAQLPGPILSPRGRCTAIRIKSPRRSKPDTTTTPMAGLIWCSVTTTPRLIRGKSATAQLINTRLRSHSAAVEISPFRETTMGTASSI